MLLHRPPYTEMETSYVGKQPEKLPSLEARGGQLTSTKKLPSLPLCHAVLQTALALPRKLQEKEWGLVSGELKNLL